MKLRLFTIIGLSCLLSATVAAQDYDDIYYDSSQQQEKAAARVEEPEPAVTTTVHDDDVIADYYTADQVPQGWEDNVVDLRNVDEYNRHIGSGDLLAQNAVGDTVSVDSTLAGGGDAFQYTERIRRFHNPDVIAESEDSDAVDLYVYTRPDVNIIVGTPTTAYVSPWGATVSFNTWGWGLSVYDPWFDPWYYDPWYYRPYWYYSSWYRPYWGWGWGGPYYAYHHHHHYHGGWWAPAPSRRYTAGGRRLYANTGHRGYAAGTTRSGSRRVAAGAGTRRQLAQVGRVGSSSQSVRRQAVTSANAARRLNGSSAIANNSINRYKARVNRVNASTSKFTTGNRVGAVTSNRVNLATGNRVNAVTTNRINRNTASTTGVRRQAASTVRNNAATTSVRRTNQLNRRPAMNSQTSTFGTGRTGYRSTSRGTSYYRNNSRSTSTYRSASPSYNRSRNTSTYRSTSRSTSSYNRSSGSSYRSTSRSSGYSRGGGAVRGSGGRGRR